MDQQICPRKARFVMAVMLGLAAFCVVMVAYLMVYHPQPQRTAKVVKTVMHTSPRR